MKIELSKLLLSGSPFDFDNVWRTVSYYSRFLLMLTGTVDVILVSQRSSITIHTGKILLMGGAGWSS